MLDTIDACQNAWYIFHGKKRSTFYNYKKRFLNGGVKVVHGNNGLKKSRSDTIAIVSSINKIVEENSYKSPHLTGVVSKDGSRYNLKIFPSNMMHVMLRKMENEGIEILGLKLVSQYSFIKVMREQFQDVSISKNNFVTRCNECISIQDKLKGTTNPAEVERL